MYKVLTLHILYDRFLSMKTKLLQIQMPIDLRKRLERLAEIDRRSMTSEALSILEEEIDARLATRKNGIPA